MHCYVSPRWTRGETSMETYRAIKKFYDCLRVDAMETRRIVEDEPKKNEPSYRAFEKSRGKKKKHW